MKRISLGEGAGTCNKKFCLVAPTMYITVLSQLSSVCGTSSFRKSPAR